VRRAAWRAAATDLDPSWLVFLDERGVIARCVPRYARAPRGERAYRRVPHNWGGNVARAGAGDGPAFVA